MTSNITSPQYPFDPTGLQTSNLIPAELQALTGATGHEYYFIVPMCGPYFRKSLSIIYTPVGGAQGSAVPLTEGVDYYCTHYFLGASRATAVEIYGSITFLNLSLKGTVSLNYQTLGGQWTVNSAQIAEILGDQIHNPRTTTWEEVQDYPVLFPPIDHEWNLVDMVGASDVVNAINLVTTAVANLGTSISVAHLQNFDNPHQVTAAQIGAVTSAEVDAKVQAAVQKYGGGSTDSLTEGTHNLFFTEERVAAADLGTLPIGNTGQIANGDTTAIALVKLQSQVNSTVQALTGKVNVNKPTTTGIPAEELIKFTATTASTPIDLSQAGAYQGTLKASTAIVFNTSFVDNAAGNVVSFALTLIQDSVGNWALAWPANVQWAGKTVPPHTMTANGKDTYYFYSEDNCATWIGSVSNENVG